MRKGEGSREAVHRATRSNRPRHPLTPKGRAAMSVVFFADSKQKKAYLSLPGSIARHLLIALDYDIEEVARDAQLAPEDVLVRISVVRRQFSLGGGQEF